MTENNLKAVVAGINGEIDGIIKHSGDLATLIITCAGHCLAHANEHGDTSLLQRLLTDGLADQPQWRGHIIRWAREYSPFNLHGSTVKLDGPNVWRLEQAMGMDPRKVGLTETDQSEAMFDAGEGLGKNLGRSDRDFADTVDRAIERAVKTMENTVYDQHGRAAGAIDPSKQYYIGSTAKDTVATLKRIRDDLKKLAAPALKAVA